MDTIDATENLPKEGEIVIAWKYGGKRAQVQIKGYTAYLWQYGITDEAFCRLDEIDKWRRCSGFDF
jgi:hypothetical protein